MGKSVTGVIGQDRTRKIRTARNILFACIASCSLPHHLQATDYVWRNIGIGPFESNTQWNPVGVPGASDTATVNVGISLISAAGADTTSLLVGDFSGSTGEILQTDGVAEASSFIGVGNGGGGTGNYELQNGTLELDANADGIQIGGGGIGNFDQSGGTVSIGDNAGFEIDGNGTYNLSAGQLNVGDASGPTNATVGFREAPANSVGLFNIDGGKAVITGTLSVNKDADNFVNITNGGTLSVGNLDLQGRQSSLFWTSGTLEVTGSQGLTVAPLTGQLGLGISLSGAQNLIVENTISVGNSNGAGSITLAAGASVSAHEIDFGNDGAEGNFTETGGSIGTEGDLGFGSNGGIGNGIFNGGSFSAEFLDVGDGGGSKGTVTLSNGVTGGADFGMSVGSSGATGTLALTGHATSLTSEQSPGFTTTIGDGGTGIMTVKQGANVQSMELVIGADGGNGSLVIDGAGSTWNAGSADVYVGSSDQPDSAGTGSLTVSNGGVFQTTGTLHSLTPNVTVNLGTLSVGNLSFAAIKTWSGGTIQVTGAAGVTTSANLLTQVSTGQTLNVTNALTVSGTDLSIAGGNVSAGSLIVQRNLSVNGILHTGTASIGSGPFSGQVNLSGAGTAWTVDNDLDLGDSSGTGGNGTLTIGSGASLTADRIILQPTTNGSTTQNSTLNLAGGTLTANKIFNEGSVSQFNWTSGTLNITSNLTGGDVVNGNVIVAIGLYVEGLNNPMGNDISLHSGQALNVTYAVVIGGSLTLDGATLTTSQLAVKSTGTFSVRNTKVIVGDGSADLITNTGLIALHHNGSIGFFSPVEIMDQGRLTSDDDANTLTFAQGVTFDSGSVLQMSPGDQVSDAGDLTDNSSSPIGLNGTSLYMNGTGAQKIVLGTPEAQATTLSALAIGTSSVSIVDSNNAPLTLQVHDLIYEGTSIPTFASGGVNVAGEVDLAGAQSVTADTTNPAGTPIFWTDTGTPANDGDFVFSNNATYTNVGSFNAENDRNFTGSGTFHNTGTFRKQASAGTTTFTIPFNNDGAVEVHSGTLSLQGGGTGSGSFLVASIGTLDFHSATYTGGTVENDGNLTVTAGAVTLGEITGTGTISIAGAPSLSTPQLSQGSLNLSHGAALNLTGSGSASTVTNADFADCNIFGSALDGTTVQANPSTLTVTGNLVVGNANLFKGLVLNITGSATAGGNNIAGDSNTVMNLTAGATFTNPGSGALFISLPFNVAGTVTANTAGGFINIGQGGTHTGTFNIGAGATIDAGGQFGASAVVNDSGTFGFVAAPTPEVFNGTLNVNSGATLTLDGPMTISSSAAVNFTDGANLGENVLSQGVEFDNNQVMNVGTANLNGGLTFRNAGLSFTTLTYGSGNGPEVLALETGGTINIGTLNLNGNELSTGLGDGHATTLNVGTFNMTNGVVSGNINVTTAMNFSGGDLDGVDGTQCTVTIEPGATLNYTGGSLNRGAVLTNNGNLSAPNGFLVGSDTSSFTSVLNIAGNSTATVTGILGAGNNGSLTTGSGHGIINVTDNASLTVAGPMILGSTIGGSGALNVSGLASVRLNGISLNDATITGGSLTVTTDPNPPAGEDPEINGAIVGGYMRDGQLNVNGGTVTAPIIKLGITTGNTGTYTQTAGSVTVGTFSAGNDGSLSAGNGIGIATVSGGTLNATTILLGSNAATGSAITAGVKPLNASIPGSGTLTITAGADVTSATTDIGAGGTLIYDDGSFSPGDVTLENGGVMNLTAGATTKVTVFNTLTITGSSSLDLSTNDADIHSTALSQIESYLESGYKNGTWNGSGIVSSAAKSTPTFTALGVEENAVQNSRTGAYTSTPILSQWENITVALSDVLVKYTLMGDADLSGSVNASDYLLIDEGFESNNVLTGWRNGDFNYDGVINGDDYSLIDNVYDLEGTTKFNAVSAGPAEMIATDTAQITQVPEPTVSLIGLTAVAFLGRRSRRLNPHR
jgi:fibronectin-binding autotransporter adhesin